MFLSVLILLFVIVFAFLAWRIVARQIAAHPGPDETYICPHCNEMHCDCRKKTSSDP